MCALRVHTFRIIKKKTVLKNLFSKRNGSVSKEQQNSPKFLLCFDLFTFLTFEVTVFRSDANKNEKDHAFIIFGVYFIKLHQNFINFRKKKI